MAGKNLDYRWDIVVPSHRYIFAVEDKEILELNREDDSPAERFLRYQDMKADHPVHGMITWPNTVLLRGPKTVLIDPGILMQGTPLILGLEQLGMGPGSVDLVINTHIHPDHTLANVYFPQATGVIHSKEVAGSGSDWGASFASSRLLEGKRGEIIPGLEFLLTPGHTDGSISVLVDTQQGTVVVAGDTVGPVPAYFEHGDLPADFPGREDLLESWERIREADPVLVIPGHNPPMTL